MIKLGYKLSAEQFGPAELLELAVAAEAHGFDTAAISDHFQPWTHSGGHAPLSFAWLGAAGARTRRIHLGTSVVAPTFRHHPAIVAQAMATLGCLFPGRIWLGVGGGEALNETPLGVAWPDARERYARLKEAVELIRLLWTRQRVDFNGAFYTTTHTTLYDRPATPIPLYIAASGPSTARLAGRVADGFICTSGKDMTLYTDTLLPAVQEGARRAQRDPDSIDRTIEMKVSFDADLQRALADTADWAALALPAEERNIIDDPVEMERRAAALPADAVASRWIVSSDPEEHVERVLAYVRLGFSHLIFHAPGRDQRRFLELYSAEVLPRLRRITD